MKLAVNYGPYQAAANKISSDPELVVKLTALQHTYPKPMPEIVARICCEYYRDEMPHIDSYRYGVFVPGPPAPEVVEGLMQFFRARKRSGTKIGDSVCEALRAWLAAMVEKADGYGGVVWSEQFHASHTPGQAFLALKDADEIQYVLAYRERKVSENLTRATEI